MKVPALGHRGNSCQSWKGKEQLSNFSSKQFPAMKPYSLWCSCKLLLAAGMRQDSKGETRVMFQAIRDIFSDIHWERAGCSYFDRCLVSTGILDSVLEGYTWKGYISCSRAEECTAL